MTLHRTPLHDWHAAHGARLVPFAGWSMPVQYTSIIEEHRAVRQGVGLFDVSHMGRVSFGGADAVAFLERMVTNRVATMALDQVRYALVCDEAGGTIDDILVYRWPYGLSLVVNASNREAVLAWFDQHLGTDQVERRDQTFDTAMIAVQGPKAVATVAGLFDTDVSKLKYYYATPTLYCRQPCVVSRTGYTGEDGFEVIVPNALAESLWSELVSRGGVPCGLGSRDTLRLEAGMPLHGHELSRERDPIAAGLGWAVALDKGPFVGQAALTQASAERGQRPRRVGLILEGKRAAREGSKIFRPDGQPAGIVTSGSFTPWLERSIAMGYVDPGAGDDLLIDVRGTQLPARVVPLPFYRRPKTR